MKGKYGVEISYSSPVLNLGSHRAVWQKWYATKRDRDNALLSNGGTCVSLPGYKKVPVEGDGG